MTEAPVALPRALPIAALERRLNWRMAPLLAFLAFLIGLASVALMAQLTPPPVVQGLPDDPDLTRAASLVRGTILPPTGALRWQSALLGEGAATASFASEARERARAAGAWVDRACVRHTWDARVWAASGALALVRGDWRGAQRAYRAALDRAPSFGEARLGLGVALALQARYAPRPFRPRALELAALAQFTAVPERDPAFAAALWNRAVLLAATGRDDQARAARLAYLARDDRSAWARALRSY